MQNGVVINLMIVLSNLCIDEPQDWSLTVSVPKNHIMDQIRSENESSHEFLDIHWHLKGR